MVCCFSILSYSASSLWNLTAMSPSPVTLAIDGDDDDEDDEVARAGDDGGGSGDAIEGCSSGSPTRCRIEH